MRHTFAVISAVACAATAAALIQYETAVRHIDRAGELLFAERSGSMQQGIASLLDAVAELTARIEVPPSVRTSVANAQQELGSGRAATDDKLGGLLRDAYKGLNGKPFQQPLADDLSEMARHLKDRLASARGLAAEGNAGESARILLAIALTIVTPVQP